MAVVDIILLCGLIAVVYLLYHHSLQASAKSFPGPWPRLHKPLSGQVWIKLLEIGRTYGPVYSLRTLRTRSLVINTADAARELLELRSARYANRRLTPMVKLSGFDRGVARERDPVRFRQGRKVIHSVMQPHELDKYDDVINKHLAIFLKGLLDTPEYFMHHARLFTAKIMLEMSHGYEAQSEDDPILREANILVANFAGATKGGYLVDKLPFLSVLPEWLPGMGFKRTARAWREQYDAIAAKAHTYVEQEIAQGTARPSMTSKMLLERTDERLSRDIIMYSAAQTYTGGADTSASTIIAFILMMVRHPKVQASAQAEIDGIGVTVPHFVHCQRDRLRYVDAVLAEVLRLMPPIPAGSSASEDDIYNGYMIHKGTILIENVWGMLHDEMVYPDPFAFRPERWKDITRADFDKHPQNVVYGYGRRVCPGRLLADRLGFLAITSILSLFDISPAYDEIGNRIIPEVEQTDGSIV
ncbi:cytochrome P450 [Earliella scabrosa]|nr:cytochrome P450 [Earliella scabrosa]